jgi:hypothetical protein
MRVRSGRQRVLTVLGVNDPIKDPHTKASARYCGVTWETFMAKAGVSAVDLWPVCAVDGSC